MLLRSALRPLLVTLVAAGLAVPAGVAAAEPGVTGPSRTGESAVRLGGAPSHNPSVDPPASTTTVVVPMVFPVIGGVSYTDTFLACRDGCSRRHLGQDLIGGKLRPLVATFDGTVSYFQRESTPGEGNILSIRSADSAWSVNYLHINNDNPGTDDGRGSGLYAFLPGLRQGSKVVRGQLVGWMGDSGNAESTGPHLHFELRKGPDAWSGTVYNAFYSLNAAQRLPAARIAMPHQPGELVAFGTGWPSMIMADGGRTAMSPSAMALYALTADDVVSVSNEELGVYPYRGAAPLLDGSVVRTPGGAYWATTSGRRYPVLLADLAGLGIPSTGAVSVTGEALLGTPLGSGVLPNGLYRHGAFIHEYGNPQMYRMDHGLLRPIHGSTWLAWHIPGARVGTVPVGTLSQYGAPAPGPVITYKDGSIYRTTSSGTFMLVNGVRRQIVDPRGQVYYNWRTKLQYVLNDSLSATLPLGQSIS